MFVQNNIEISLKFEIPVLYSIFDIVEFDINCTRQDFDNVYMFNFGL